MRAKNLLWIIGLGLIGSGCSVVSTATTVVSSRMKDTIEGAVEQRRNQAWAKAAWDEDRAANPGVAYSDDHAKGFKTGFTEHLYRGAVLPPPLPPEGYRRARYQTPEGYRAIEDWFAGFRHGALVAQAGGYRHYVTGPSSLRPPIPVPPPPQPLVGNARAAQKEMCIRIEWVLPKWSIPKPW